MDNCIMTTAHRYSLNHLLSRFGFNSDWWLVSVTLVVLLVFALKFWEVVRTYKLLFSLKRNTASVVLTMLGGGDTKTLLDGKKN